MANFLRYLAASLCLGAVGYLASEAMFWSFPPDGVTVPQIALTCLAYALAGGAALSSVLWAGLGGWRAAFLGGAILGFAVEGAVVGTMYEGFPLQLVWTPLAWHALFSGLAVFGGALAAARWALERQVALMVALGLFGGVWSLYWPLERPVLPPPSQTWAYLAGTGLLALAALVVFDRLLPALRPSRAVVWVMPVLLLLLFIVQSVADPRPQRLAWPVMMLATLWAMRRLGRMAAPVALPPVPLWRHLPALIPPLATALVATTLVPPGGVEVNWPVALLTGAVSLVLWFRLLWQAYRASA